MLSDATKAALLATSKTAGIPIMNLKINLGIANPVRVLSEFKSQYHAAEPDQKDSILGLWNTAAAGFIDECLDFNEAKTLYSYEYINWGTSAWRLIEDKVSEFGVDLLDGMSLREIKTTFQKFPPESEAYKKAVRLWNEITLADLAEAGDDITLVRKVVSDACNPSAAQDKAVKKLDSLVKQLLKKVTNRNEALCAYKVAPLGSQTQFSAFKKVLSFATTFNSATAALGDVQVRGSREESIAFSKCLALGTFYDLVRFYHSDLIVGNGTHQWHVKQKIEKVALTYAAKVKQTKNVRDIYAAFANNYSLETKKILLNRWEKLAYAEVASLHTIEDLQMVSKYIPEDSPSRKLFIQKMFEIANSAVA